MSAFAAMLVTTYPCKIYSFPAERQIQTFTTGFLSEGFKTQINLTSWEGVLVCWKDRLLFSYLTPTDILTEHCSQETMLNNHLPGSHKMDLISFSCSFNLLAIMTAKIFKNSTAIQDR